MSELDTLRAEVVSLRAQLALAQALAQAAHARITYPTPPVAEPMLLAPVEHAVLTLFLTSAYPIWRVDIAQAIQRADPRIPEYNLPHLAQREIKRLSARMWITYADPDGWTLTPSGRAYAQRLIDGDHTV